MDLIVPRGVYEAILGAVTTHGVPSVDLSAPVVLLFTNDIIPDPDTLNGDLIQPTWTGLTTPTVAWGGPIESALTGGPIVLGSAVTIVCTGPPEATVYGHALAAGPEGSLYQIARWDEPVPVTEGTSLVILPEWGPGLSSPAGRTGPVIY